MPPLSREAEAFLEMLQAERGASRNTTTAYGTDLRDLTDGPGVKVPFGWGAGGAAAATLAGSDGAAQPIGCGCDTEGLTRVLAGDAGATHALWGLHNVVLTPHVAAHGPYLDDRRFDCQFDIEVEDWRFEFHFVFLLQ